MVNGERPSHLLEVTMDRFELMQIAVTVVDTGSLSAAARQLDQPLPTVSRKVAALEGHLKTRIFTRASRRIGLTDAGSEYVRQCRRLLVEIGEVERAAAGEYSEPKGELVISAPLVFGRLHVLPVINQYLGAYPEVDVRLSLSDQIANLLEERIDLAVRIGKLPDSSLIATRLGTIHWVTCASPAYLKRHGMPKDPEALHEHHCVTFDGASAPDSWHFGEGRSERNVRVHSRLVVSTAEAAIDAAVSGVGITRVLSYQAANAVAAGSLRLILKAHDSLPRPVSFAYRAGRLLPQKLRAFLDFATPRLRGALDN
jgi:DNA-binding transcriptional LysR family regulator